MIIEKGTKHMKVIVMGPRGKMGKLITQVAAQREDMELVAGVAPKGRDYIGTDLGTAAMVGRELGVPVTDDLASVIDDCDQKRRLWRCLTWLWLTARRWCAARQGLARRK